MSSRWIAVVCFGLGALFLGSSLFVYRSQSLVRRMRQLPWYRAYMLSEGGTWFALRPWGVAMLGFAVFFLLPRGSAAQLPIVLVSLILMAAGLVFTVWVPSWAKPPWARH